jgi:S-adenosylmethionine:tRNA ribosyltransferase-isomerase
MNASLTPADFDYELPVDRIAMHPADRRDAARLLHYQNGQIVDREFSDTAHLLPKGSQLVVNNTRVIHARLIAHKPTGGKIELFLLRPAHGSVEQAMEHTGASTWMCLVGGAKRWKNGVITASVDELSLEATMFEKQGDEYLINLKWTPGSLAFRAVVEQIGRIPLPPYIAREANDDDRLRYQTRFAERPGSVAAPTAGLHFTDALMTQLPSELVRLTLHVSAGTFKPMADGSIAQHLMHHEQCEVTREAIAQLAKPMRRYAVGTTSLRTLESLYWLAVKWKQSGRQPKSVNQHEPYELYAEFSGFCEAMAWLTDALDRAGLSNYGFETSMMIAPGYDIRSIDGLFTNFHMPKSTLLLLVAALIGDDWRKVYAHALANGYRFLSYGDGSLLER